MKSSNKGGGAKDENGGLWSDEPIVCTCHSMGALLVSESVSQLMS